MFQERLRWFWNQFKPKMLSVYFFFLLPWWEIHLRLEQRISERAVCSFRPWQCHHVHPMSRLLRAALWFRRRASILSLPMAVVPRQRHAVWQWTKCHPLLNTIRRRVLCMGWSIASSIPDSCITIRLNYSFPCRQKNPKANLWSSRLTKQDRVCMEFTMLRGIPRLPHWSASKPAVEWCLRPFGIPWKRMKWITSRSPLLPFCTMSLRSGKAWWKPHRGALTWRCCVVRGSRLSNPPLSSTAQRTLFMIRSGLAPLVKKASVVTEHWTIWQHHPCHCLPIPWWFWRTWFRTINRAVAWAWTCTGADVTLPTRTCSWRSSRKVIIIITILLSRWVARMESLVNLPSGTPTCITWIMRLPWRHWLRLVLQSRKWISNNNKPASSQPIEIYMCVCVDVPDDYSMESLSFSIVLIVAMVAEENEKKAQERSQR